MSKIDLKNYVCAVPFVSFEVQHKNRFLCCASWLTKFLPIEDSLKNSWESEDATEIRKSVLDGSYKYCDKGQCPFLHQLIKFGEVGNTNTLYHKNNIPDKLKEKIDSFNNGVTQPPTTIQFSFDRTCNLKCPSCRVDLIVENSIGIQRIKKTIEDIEYEYGKTTKILYITGSGDPFVSVGFRDFLREFDKTKWPSLERIHLHTNATKWNKKMWDSMKNVHTYIKTCEISIDAGSKETYEDKVRLGGNWDELIENLRFINTIPTLKNIKTSFVVQKENYKEMKQFYELMISIFGKKVEVFYGKINNWGTFTNEIFIDHKIWDTNHPEYLEFVDVVNSFLPTNQCWHNLQEFIKPKKDLI
jgi:hypothetical protein